MNLPSGYSCVGCLTPTGLPVSSVPPVVAPPAPRILKLVFQNGAAIEASTPDLHETKHLFDYALQQLVCLPTDKAGLHQTDRTPSTGA